MDSLHPPEWNDSQTMDVLFSPFRENRDVNPSSWDRKMIFWKSMIRKYVKLNKTAGFSSKTLPVIFERNGKVPVCLPIVIEDLLRDGKIRKFEDLYSDLSSGWLSWTVGLLVKKPIQWTVGTFVKKPLSWTFNKMFGSEDLSEPDVQYIIMNQLTEIAYSILDLHNKSIKSEITDCVIGYEDLKLLCKAITEDETSFHLAVLFLCKKNKCTVTLTDTHEKVVTFQRQGPQSPVNTSNLSESDMKIYKLKLTERQLATQISDLTQEMEKLRLEAKLNLKRGEKIAAKNCLRRKKKTEVWKHNKEEALENIRHLISVIQQAETNKIIVDAYSSGVSAYKDIKEKYGLTTDRIDDVMDSVQEAYEIHNNLDDSMSFNPMEATEPSTEELETELNELLSGDGGSAQLPVPPEGDPHQDLVNALCTMKITEDITGTSNVDEYGLPQVPSHDPTNPPKAATFAKPDSPQKKIPVIG